MSKRPKPAPLRDLFADPLAFVLVELMLTLEARGDWSAADSADVLTGAHDRLGAYPDAQNQLRILASMLSGLRSRRGAADP